MKLLFIEGEDMRPIASFIDHTLLKPNSTKEDIIKLCAEAEEFKFATVCVHPYWVKAAAEQLKNSDVGVATVVGFPLGATTTKVKVTETEEVIKSGATEIDMVINIGALKSGDEETVFNEIKEVVNVAKNVAVKVIIETALLTEEEKMKACRLSEKAGAQFVKTSTGFSSGGATVEDVTLMRETVGENIGIKASGGIRDRKTAEAMIRAGASRIGASASVEIVTE